MNALDVICRKEQQVELLKQISKIERSPKAQLCHEFEARNLIALKLNRASVGLTTAHLV